MGLNSSKINYYKIDKIIGPFFINNKLNEYIIIYNNGTDKKVQFTKNKEKEFNNIYKHSLLLKPVAFIKYSNIDNITNFKIFTDLESTKIINDDIYSFDITYLDKSTQTLNLNKYQEDTFWKLFKLMNRKKYEECKNVIKVLINK